MSDKLVNDLRGIGDELLERAADRIADLEAENERLRARLERSDEFGRVREDQAFLTAEALERAQSMVAALSVALEVCPSSGSEEGLADALRSWERSLQQRALDDAEQVAREREEHLKAAALKEASSVLRAPLDTRNVTRTSSPWASFVEALRDRDDRVWNAAIEESTIPLVKAEGRILDSLMPTSTPDDLRSVLGALVDQIRTLKGQIRVLKRGEEES